MAVKVTGLRRAGELITSSKYRAMSKRYNEIANEARILRDRPAPLHLHETIKKEFKRKTKYLKKAKPIAVEEAQKATAAQIATLGVVGTAGTAGYKKMKKTAAIKSPETSLKPGHVTVTGGPFAKFFAELDKRHLHIPKT